MSDERHRRGGFQTRPHETHTDGTRPDGRGESRPDGRGESRPDGRGESRPFKTRDGGRGGFETRPYPGRHSIRLRGYDYAACGAYFVTLCTQGRVALLGEVLAGEVVLNPLGRIVRDTWDALPVHYPHVALDAFVVMPNHVHAIIVLTDIAVVGAGLKPAPTEPAVVRAGFKPAPTRHGLPEILRAFKTFSARKINALRGAPGTAVWQRNYYERIIRDDRELWAIQEYIANNPIQWMIDRENPQRCDHPTR
jgi:REP element-mobilizing transposase RayT